LTGSEAAAFGHEIRECKTQLLKPLYCSLPVSPGFRAKLVHDVVKSRRFDSENPNEQVLAVPVVRVKLDDLPENRWRFPDTAVMLYPLLATPVRD